MLHFLNKFPPLNKLPEWHRENPGQGLHAVNGHIHTPYSFSAFSDMEQAFKMACEENVRILGINDFYTTAGYEEFHRLSEQYRIFPLFNIEFTGLLKDEQQKGIRINDPDNPGRIYFSGKGLDFPVRLSHKYSGKLKMILDESHKQTREMTGKASEYLISLDKRLRIDFNEILHTQTYGMLRERHIARAIRMKVAELYKNTEEKESFYKNLLGGRGSFPDVTNPSALENEIRAVLLKAEGQAFVRESSGAFPELDELIEIILEAGGIPCYPTLLDNKKGNMTEFENDYDALYSALVRRKIYCIELIPGRNDARKLKDFVTYFHEKNFIITLGSEHNTPDLSPISLTTRNGIPLDEDMKRISFEGACVIAAHQYLRAQGMNGYTGEDGMPDNKEKEKYVEIGKAVIEYFLRSTF